MSRTNQDPVVQFLLYVCTSFINAGRYSVVFADEKERKAKFDLSFLVSLFRENASSNEGNPRKAQFLRR